MSEKESEVIIAKTVVTKREEIEGIEINDTTLENFISHEKIKDVISTACKRKVEELSSQETVQKEKRMLFYIFSGIVGLVGSGFFISGLFLQNFASQYLGAFLIGLVLISFIQRGIKIGRT